MEKSPEPPDLPEDAWVIDPVFGRRVTVPDRAFAKIARSHGDVAHLGRRDLLEAIAHADVTLPNGRRSSRHRYLRAGVGPSRWLCVIVEYDRAGFGEAIDAYACRRIPRRTG